MDRFALRVERKNGPAQDTLICGLEQLEVKFAEGDDKTMSFTGYGAVFGNVDSYGDVIQKGAFRETLREAKKSGVWPKMLLQHGGFGWNAEDMTPIGIWTEMAEDDTGLKVEGQLAETVRGKEAYTLLKMKPRPALDGLSIGFRAKEFALGTKPDEPRRTLKKVELLEVSLVTFPANPKARMTGIKSANGLSIRDAEKALRDAGFSSSEAKGILARGFKGLTEDATRDAGATGSEIAELVASLKRNASILSA